MRRLSLSGRPVVVFPRRKAYAIQAYLARRPERCVAREVIATVLWGESSGEAARHSRRQALLDVRRTMPDGPVLVVEGEGVGLAPRVEVDVDRFVQTRARLQVAP